MSFLEVLLLLTKKSICSVLDFHNVELNVTFSHIVMVLYIISAAGKTSVFEIRVDHMFYV